MKRTSQDMLYNQQVAIIHKCTTKTVEGRVGSESFVGDRRRRQRRRRRRRRREEKNHCCRKLQSLTVMGAVTDGNKKRV